MVRSSAAGRTESPPERSILIFGIFRTTEDIPKDFWPSYDLAPRSPYVLLGDMEAMVEALHERRERLGLSYFVCFDEDLERFLPLVRRMAS